MASPRSPPRAPAPARTVPISTDYRNLMMVNANFFDDRQGGEAVPWPDHDIPMGTSEYMLLTEAEAGPEEMVVTPDGKPARMARYHTRLVAVSRTKDAHGRPLQRIQITRADGLFHLLCPNRPFRTADGFISPTPTLVVSMPTFTFIRDTRDADLRDSLLEAFSFVGVAGEGPKFIRGPGGAPRGTACLDVHSVRRAPLPPWAAAPGSPPRPAPPV